MLLQEKGIKEVLPPEKRQAALVNPVKGPLTMWMLGTNRLVIELIKCAF